MVTRKIELKTYFTVGIITLLIFSLGIALGVIIDNERVRNIEQKSKEQELQQQSLQFQQLYISSLEAEKSACPVFKVTLTNSLNDLGESLERLEQYSKDSNVNKKEFDFLTRDYILDNLRYWLFARKTRELCDMDFVEILYFFSDKCNNCPDQGVILTYYKKIFKERLLVFPINVDYESEEKSIKMLRERYNVTELPAIVVKDMPYKGVVQKEPLKEVICSSFQTEQEEC